MTKNIQSSFKKRRDDALLNTFAVVMACLPLISIGYWVQNQFFNDDRRVIALGEIDPSTTPRLFDEPLISVTFDDGWESVYSNGAPILEQYDIRTTQYILPGQFNAPNYLSLAQVQSMKQAGHEIAPHTMTHPKLTDIPLSDAHYEMRESRNVLLRESLGNDPMPFASPNGATSPETMAEIRRLYSSHRNVWGSLSDGIDQYDVNVDKNFDRYNIMGFSVRNDTTDEQLRDAMAYTKKHNGWFVLIYHQVDDSGDTYSVTPEMLERQLRIVRDSQIKTAPLGEVINHRGGRSL